MIDFRLWLVVFVNIHFNLTTVHPLPISFNIPAEDTNNITDMGYKYDIDNQK